ncbi:unnamed protein product [Pylaiella littoralis]
MESVREDLVQLAGSDRGGVIQGYTPIHSHVQLYLVQIILIVVMCFVLGQVVKIWNQPRVIAEVMAGVLLGPSAFGAIPGFTDTLFPDESLEALTLTAHLGLILFLFIVGLELDPALLKSNAKKASILSLTGQSVTWVLSLGVSRAMITWMDDVEASTSFVLFIGVSLSVTAFPVLSRILGENSLLNTTVGALVISAASVDEACVWCLLALVVSTVNAGSPLDAFYVFLLLVFFVGIMLTVVRRALLYVVRRVSGEVTGAPPRGVVILCLLLTLVSAWVTDFIGIDAIFGAFVAGIIVPREHSLHVRIVELVQDVVSVLLLPIYFAVSGLKTDLTLLDNATSWGICALTIAAACLGKIGGGAAVARVFGMTTRESLAVGVLMNTRGLVELIILNIGLDAGVLTEEVMAIMVVMALVTTFLTAPLSSFVYPLKYHTVPGRKRRRRISEESAATRHSLSRALSSIPELGEFAQARLKLMVIITNPTALDAVTRIARLFSGNQQPVAKKAGSGAIARRKGSSGGGGGGDKGEGLVVHALRLVENTDRFSSDMRALEKGETLMKDGLAGILQGFLGLLRIKVLCHVSVGTPTDFCQDLTRLSEEHSISTIVFPWDAGTSHLSAQLTRAERLMHSTQSQFVLAFNCHTAALASSGLSLLVPFFGGDDDTAALLLALAITERDTSAELVILSFLEPENPSTQTGAGGNGDGTGISIGGGANRDGAGADAAASHDQLENGSLMAVFENNAPGDIDVEAGGAAAVVTQPKSNANNSALAATAATSDVPPTGTVPLGGWGGGNRNCVSGAAPTAAAAAGAVAGIVHGSSWSARELVRRAEALDRVRITRAWSLNAALGAMSASSPSPRTSPSSTSAAASIVLEVVRGRSTGLVLCGCAGSGQLAAAVSPAGQQQQQQQQQREPGGSGGGGGGGSGPPPRATTNGNGNRNVPLSGASMSVHGKWPSIAAGSRLGPGSRSVTTRSWHGKSRHHARGSHRAREAAAAANGRFAADAGGPNNPRHGGLASAVQGVINDALWDIVGDVAAGLVRSEPATAVLAVRASVRVVAPAGTV